MFKVAVTRDGSKVSVMDPDLGKPLLRIDGDWFVGVPTAEEGMEDFVWVKDSKEATTLLQEAAAALSDNPNLPRAADQAS